MAYFMMQGAFTDKAWAAMAAKPQNREELFGAVVRKAGGRIHGYWFSFGDYDSVVIVEVPDNVSAAALSVSSTAEGAFKALRTTPLMTPQEGVAFMKKAASLERSGEYRKARKALA
jgi:uncharacterized protein with GYD domain